jgi:outer membrane lipoprotein-sorting protein
MNAKQCCSRRASDQRDALIEHLGKTMMHTNLVCMFLALWLSDMYIAVQVPSLVAIPSVSKNQENKPDDKLAAVLKKWEAAESGVKDVRRVIERSRYDAVFRETIVNYIEALGKKPDLLRFEVKNAKKEPTSTIVWSGNRIRIFDHARTIVTECDILLKRPDGWSDPAGMAAFLISSYVGFQEHLQLNKWFCLGFDVRQLADRYTLSVLKEDEHYYFIRAKPHRLADSQFDSILIAIGKTDLLVRGMRLHEPTGNTTTLDCTKVMTNLTSPVTTEMVEANLPQGWDKQEFPIKPPSGSK